MKRLTLIIFLMLPLLVSAQKSEKDWANYGRYEKANADLVKSPAVVFMGNSITQGWYEAHPEFFDDNNFAGRGISGQVTSQMLSRFQSDVIALHPKAVVILAGTNDIARNNGYISLEHIAQNIESMIQLAKYNKIDVILCTVLPVKSYSWRKDLGDVSQTVVELNRKLETLADKYGCRWVDLYSQTVAEDGGFESGYTRDGVHPNAEGYRLMEQIIYPTLKRYVKK